MCIRDSSHTSRTQRIVCALKHDTTDSRNGKLQSHWHTDIKPVSYTHLVAWGLKRLLDRIPYEDAVSIRMQLVGHYGKTGYYRFYRGERGLMPKRCV